MRNGSREHRPRLRVVEVRRAPDAPALADGLGRRDPDRFLLLGTPFDAEDVAVPHIDDLGRIALAPGERRLGRWAAREAVVTRVPVGARRPDAEARWIEAAPPVVSLTTRRVILHGATLGAHAALERIAGLRLVRRGLRATVAIEVLVHAPNAASASRVFVEVTMRRRAASRLVAAIAEAHRARWARSDLDPALRHLASASRMQRWGRELRLEPVLFVPLGMTDAIRGPGAGRRVPQRVRVSWPDPRTSREMFRSPERRGTGRHFR